jgi:hypothetical protein
MNIYSYEFNAKAHKLVDRAKNFWLLGAAYYPKYQYDYWLGIRAIFDL